MVICATNCSIVLLNVVVAVLLDEFIRSLLLYTRSLLPYTRLLLPYTRSLLPYTRSLLPYTRSLLTRTLLGQQSFCRSEVAVYEWMRGCVGGRKERGERERREGEAHPTPYLHPTYTLHPTPYTLHPTPYALHPTPYALHPRPYTLHPTPYTLHPKPGQPNHVLQRHQSHSPAAV